jgi:branched-chain amino acid transport system ATP-binding protein
VTSSAGGQPPAEQLAAATLRVRQLVINYGAVVAVRSIDLDVGSGQVVALLGPNGAGKSSTLRAIAGLVSPRGGVVTLNGENVTGIAAELVVRRGIVMVPEGRRVFASLSVDENLRLGASSQPDPRLRQADRDEVFALFPILGERTRQAAGTLSGGEQQQLAIARALMGRPRLLLLDEPSLGLAPIMVRAVFRMLAQLKRRGMTMLVVEQNAAQALALADYAYAMVNGRIVAQGSSTDFRDRNVLASYYLGGEQGS